PPDRVSSTARSSSCPRATSSRSSCATNGPRSGASGPGYICETSRMRTAPAYAGTDIPAPPPERRRRNAALFREELRHRLHLLPIGGVREVAEAELRLERREERVVV